MPAVNPCLAVTSTTAPCGVGHVFRPHMTRPSPWVPHLAPCDAFDVLTWSLPCTVRPTTRWEPSPPRINCVAR